jgi:hypothetical protein
LGQSDELAENGFRMGNAGIAQLATYKAGNAAVQSWFEIDPANGSVEWENVLDRGPQVSRGAAQVERVVPLHAVVLRRRAQRGGVITSLVTSHRSRLTGNQGRGCGVGRGRGAGVALGVGVGVGVGVGPGP